MKNGMDEEKELSYNDEASLNFDEKAAVWAVALGVLAYLIKLIWEWFI